MKPNYSIDIAINCFRPEGGMESYTFDLVRGLSAHGIKPTVFALHKSIQRFLNTAKLIRITSIKKRFQKSCALFSSVCNWPSFGETEIFPLLPAIPVIMLISLSAAVHT